MVLQVEEVALGRIVRLLNKTPGVVTFGVDFQAPNKKANGHDGKKPRERMGKQVINRAELFAAVATTNDLNEVAKVFEGRGATSRQIRQRISVSVAQYKREGLMKKLPGVGQYALTSKGKALVAAAAKTET
jgi:hypothetical protein